VIVAASTFAGIFCIFVALVFAYTAGRMVRPAPIMVWKRQNKKTNSDEYYYLIDSPQGPLLFTEESMDVARNRGSKLIK
jgi:hypothetical protein